MQGFHPYDEINVTWSQWCYKWGVCGNISYEQAYDLGSCFMLHVLHAPLYPKEIDKKVNDSTISSYDFDYGEEAFTICIANEVRKKHSI